MDGFVLFEQAAAETDQSSGGAPPFVGRCRNRPAFEVAYMSRARQPASRRWEGGHLESRTPKAMFAMTFSQILSGSLVSRLCL